MSSKTSGFGHKMRLRIAVLDVTITDVARALGCARQNVSAILDSTSATTDTIRKYELTLGVSEGWLTVPQTIADAQIDAERFPVPDWLKRLRATKRRRKARKNNTGDDSAVVAE